MKLASFLSQTGQSHAEFAARIGTSQAAVSRYVTGARTPKRAVMERISAVTGGQVTPNDFLGAATAPAEEAA